MYIEFLPVVLQRYPDHGIGGLTESCSFDFSRPSEKAKIDEVDFDLVVLKSFPCPNGLLIAINGLFLAGILLLRSFKWWHPSNTHAARVCVCLRRRCHKKATWSCKTMNNGNIWKVLQEFIVWQIELNWYGQVFFKIKRRLQTPAASHWIMRPGTGTCCVFWILVVQWLTELTALQLFSVWGRYPKRDAAPRHLPKVPDMAVWPQDANIKP